MNPETPKKLLLWRWERVDEEGKVVEVLGSLYIGDADKVSYESPQNWKSCIEKHTDGSDAFDAEFFENLVSFQIYEGEKLAVGEDPPMMNHAQNG